MLESAITKSSDSVALDLLTYADLESLRKAKLSSSGSTNGHGFTPGRSKTPSPHAKRYLILTYSVEFDRYLTLPLVYLISSVLLLSCIEVLASEYYQFCLESYILTTA